MLLRSNGTTVVAPILSDKSPALLVVDLATGQSRVLTTSPADSGLAHLNGIFPLAVFLDGVSALVGLADKANFIATKMARVDLRTAEVKLYNGFADDPGRLGPAVGAVYPPDGSRIVAVEGFEDRQFALGSASSTDSRFRNAARFKEKAPFKLRLT